MKDVPADKPNVTINEREVKFRERATCLLFRLRTMILIGSWVILQDMDLT